MRMLMTMVLALSAAGTVWGESTLSPRMDEAVKGLRAEGYQQRQEASKAMEEALVEQFRALSTVRDPEARSRVTALMAVNDSLSRWMLDMAELTDEQRASQTAWGLGKDVYPVIAKVYSPDAEMRAEGVRALGKMKGEEPSWLLGRLVGDDDRAVYVAAMEAVYERKLGSAPVVNALWHRAVEAGLPENRAVRTVNRGPEVKFRGRVLPGGAYMDMSYRQHQDHDIATETLIEIDSDLVAEKVVDFLKRMSAQQDGAAVAGGRVVWSPYLQPVKNVYAIAEAYRPREALPILIDVVGGRVVQKNNGKVNNEAYFWSNRTPALVAAARIAGMDFDDLKLKKQARLSGMWTFPSEKDEDAAVEKLEKWWEANKEKFAAEKGERAPASRPAEEAGGDAAGDVKIQIRGGGVIRLEGGNGGIEVREGQVEIQLQNLRIERKAE